LKVTKIHSMALKKTVKIPLIETNGVKRELKKEVVVAVAAVAVAFCTRVATITK
jgi:hypothetical protein